MPARGRYRLHWRGRLRRWSRRAPWLRWALFAAAGLVAFGVDMSVLAALVYGLDVLPAHARLVSILAAASAAWYCNRRFTFADTSVRRRWAQWLRYLAVNTVNVVINYGSYAGLVMWTDLGREHPLLAVLPGALAGLWVNYLLASRLVFDARHEKATVLSSSR